VPGLKKLAREQARKSMVDALPDDQVSEPF